MLIIFTPDDVKNEYLKIVIIKHYFFPTIRIYMFDRLSHCLFDVLALSYV